jgi:hypothetical protein
VPYLIRVLLLILVLYRKHMTFRYSTRYLNWPPVCTRAGLYSQHRKQFRLTSNTHSPKMKQVQAALLNAGYRVSQHHKVGMRRRSNHTHSGNPSGANGSQDRCPARGMRMQAPLVQFSWMLFAFCVHAINVARNTNTKFASTQIVWDIMRAWVRRFAPKAWNLALGSE